MAIKEKEEPQVNTLIISKGNSLLTTASTLQVTNEVTASKAVDLCDELRGFLKDADEDRKRITGPINTSLREINSKYKKITGPIEEVMNGLRSKLLAYRRQVEEDSLRAQGLKRTGPMCEADGPDDGEVEILDGVDVIAPRVFGSGGRSAGLVGKWTYEVEDILLVPRKYLVIDDRHVQADINAGVREIPGLIIKEEKSLRIA